MTTYTNAYPSSDSEEPTRTAIIAQAEQDATEAATAAATSADAAAASASAASTSAANAATSASSASTSASAAATSATNAATSATNAATSATAAGTSATSAGAHAATSLGYSNEAEAARDAALAALSDAAVITGEWPRVSRSSLKGLDYNTITTAYLTDEGYEGVFIWRPASHATHLEVEQFTFVSYVAGTDTCTYIPTLTTTSGNYHQLDTGSVVYFKTSTANLTAYTKYYVIRTSTTAFKLATTFANAKAGTAIDLTTAPPTMYRHGDGHEGIYIIPNGLNCDGSQGAWKRVTTNNTYNAAWWGLDTTFAHNQALLTDALHAVPDGATLYIPPHEDPYPVSRYTWLRWRRNLTVIGELHLSHLQGDGTASSVFRVVRHGCKIMRIKGGNFSGQVLGEIQANDANHSESCGVHALSLDEGMGYDDPATGDQNENIVVDNCIFYDLDSGVTVAANMWNQITGSVSSLAPVGYYKWSDAWVTNNRMTGIRRQGIEIFLTERATATGNHITMGEKGVGFAASRAVRACGCLYINVHNNLFIGDDEATAGNRGVSIETASMSLYDDPQGVRHGGQAIVTDNYLENFSEHIAFVGARGAVKIADNIMVGDPEVRTAAKTATITLANPAVVTIANHLLVDGAAVTFTTDGALPASIVAGTTYYVRNAATSTFELSVNKLGDTSIDTSADSQSGVHTATIPRASEVLTWAIRNISTGHSEGGAEDDVTITIASPAVVTWGAPALMRVKDDNPVSLYTDGTLPTGLTHGAQYYARNVNTGAGTFELALTPGGASINTSGAQSGTHRILNNRYDGSKNQTDMLTIENNQSYSTAIFYEFSGAARYQKIEGNTHIGNANSQSRFAVFTGQSSTIGLAMEQNYNTFVQRNTSICNALTATQSISVVSAQANEAYFIDDNDMTGSSSGSLVGESGTTNGSIYIKTRYSNRLIPTGRWKVSFNPPRYNGVFDLGNYPP